MMPLFATLVLTSPRRNVCRKCSPARSAEGRYRRSQLIFFFYRPCAGSSSSSLPTHMMPLLQTLVFTSPRNGRRNCSPARSAEGRYRRSQLIFFFYRPCAGSSSSSLPTHIMPLLHTLALTSPRNVHRNCSPACSAEGHYRRSQRIFFFYRPWCTGSSNSSFLDILCHFLTHWFSLRPVV
jgi:hypothetical protein